MEGKRKKSKGKIFQSEEEAVGGGRSRSKRFAIGRIKKKGGASAGDATKKKKMNKKNKKQGSAAAGGCIELTMSEGVPVNDQGWDGRKKGKIRKSR